VKATYPMNSQQNKEMIEAGVYDSSHRISGSYWQWGNVSLDPSWDEVAELVHQGWPAEQRKFPDQQAVLLGVVRRPERTWLYRVYPAGRDGFGRPGRYFFVVLRLPSPDWIVHPQVAGLLAYFEKERGLPLKIEPLERGWPDGEADPALLQIHKEFQEHPRSSHWGMDGAGRTIQFKYPEEPKRQGGQGDAASAGKFILGAGVILAAAVGAFLLKPSSQVVSQEDEEGAKTASNPLPSGPTQTTPPKIDAPSGASGSQSDGRTPPEVTDPAQENITGDKDPSGEELPPVEVDDPSPPDQPPSHPPQPPTDPPIIPKNP
jgi:hypothetical protein